MINTSIIQLESLRVLLSTAKGPLGLLWHNKIITFPDEIIEKMRT